MESYKGPRFYDVDVRRWKAVKGAPPSIGDDLATKNAPLASELAEALACGRALEQSLIVRLTALGIKFEDYVRVGDTFYQPFDPKLVIIPPITRRSGDCHCPCERCMLPLRVAEGTTIHSLQGINVGSNKQVKRLGIDFGKSSVEQKMPGLSMVAQSRAQGKADFCYTAPLELERFAVCGTTSGARALKAANDAFEEQATDSDACKFRWADYEALLQWAASYAKEHHGIDAPWERRSDASGANEMDVEQGGGDASSSRSRGKRPAEEAFQDRECEMCVSSGDES